MIASAFFSFLILPFHQHFVVVSFSRLHILDRIFFYFFFSCVYWAIHSAETDGEKKNPVMPFAASTLEVLKATSVLSSLVLCCEGISPRRKQSRKYLTGLKSIPLLNMR